PGRNIWWGGYASINSITNVRHFIGLSSTTLTNQGGSDLPTAYNYAGFLFTTDAGCCDATHYWCIINNGTGPVASASSGVTVAANVGHKFDIREDTTNSKWYFFIDQVPTPVCTFTSSNPLPTA